MTQRRNRMNGLERRRTVTRWSDVWAPTVARAVGYAISIIFGKVICNTKELFEIITYKTGSYTQVHQLVAKPHPS